MKDIIAILATVFSDGLIKNKAKAGNCVCLSVSDYKFIALATIQDTLFK